MLKQLFLIYNVEYIVAAAAPNWRISTHKNNCGFSPLTYKDNKYIHIVTGILGPRHTALLLHSGSLSGAKTIFSFSLSLPPTIQLFDCIVFIPVFIMTAKTRQAGKSSEDCN